MIETKAFLLGFRAVLDQIAFGDVEAIVAELALLKRRRGRLFVLGVGGSAANASHAVNDFRKIAQIESYAPTDNVAELTARVNDESWPVTFDVWLATSHVCANDAILVLSVGGGSETASPNIKRAVQYAHTLGVRILGIVGRDGGETARLATACVLMPTVDETRITPYCEAMQGVLLHAIVTNTALLA